MGQIVTVVPKTDISLDGRTSVTQTMPLLNRVRTVDWVSGVLSARLHTKNTWSATATLTLLVQNVHYCEDEPQTAFVGGTVATLSFTNSDTAPAIKIAALDDEPIGTMLRVVLQWAQGGTAATVAQTVSISLDLVGRAR